VRPFADDAGRGLGDEPLQAVSYQLL